MKVFHAKCSVVGIVEMGFQFSAFQQSVGNVCDVYSGDSERIPFVNKKDKMFSKLTILNYF